MGSINNPSRNAANKHQEMLQWRHSPLQLSSNCWVLGEVQINFFSLGFPKVSRDFHSCQLEMFIFTFARLWLCNPLCLGMNYIIIHIHSCILIQLYLEVHFTSFQAGLDVRSQKLFVEAN